MPSQKMALGPNSLCQTSRGLQKCKGELHTQDTVQLQSLLRVRVTQVWEEIKRGYS